MHGSPGVTTPGPLADELQDPSSRTARRIAANPIPVRRDNLVERPWGGHRILDYKGLDRAVHGDRRFGEVFEIAAYPVDPEAGAHPSVVCLPDGSELALPDLLAVAADSILGEDLARAYGPCIPLLPKTLDVESLLSVQAHPPGHPEAYIVLEAEAGATIRLGFRRDIDPGALAARLRHGRQTQEALLDALRLARPGDRDGHNAGAGDVTDDVDQHPSGSPGQDRDQHLLQATLAPLLARADCTSDERAAALAPLLPPGVDRARMTRCLDLLADIYREVLALMNEIPVTPGQVLFNATPPGSGTRPSAEVHALGNPQGKAILLLEIRCPCPTLRAWDHVRFPMRALDIDGALSAMRCRASRPDDFVRPRRPTGTPGVLRSVDSEIFTIDHVCLGTRARAPHAPPPGPQEVRLHTGGRFRTLHAIHGRADITDARGQVVGHLRRGESALLPAALGAYGIRAVDGAAEVVQVFMPGSGPGPGQRAGA